MSVNEGASREAIQYHYDIGNDFYAAWLDREMVYSAALWPDDQETELALEEAQRAKLDWHIASAALKSGDRLLDVGCGWGGLMRRAVECHQLAEAVGLTLSDEQSAWILQNTDDPRISVYVREWQQFQDDTLFDAVISIGALEHFAKPELDQASKLRCYSDFFQFCSDLLVDEGRLSLQAITWMNMKSENETDNLPTQLFPESNLPYPIEVLTAADDYFELLEYHNRPQDYSKTLRQWMKRIRENRADLSTKFGKSIVRRYMRGFTEFVLGFDNGIIGLSRFSFKKKKRFSH